MNLVLDRTGKVVRSDNVSGDPELTAAVLMAVQTWQFERLKVGRLHRVFRFKKSPTSLDFGQEGLTLVTKSFEPPSSSELDFQHLRQVIRDPEEGIAAFQICVQATGSVESVKLLFTNNRHLAKPLLEHISKAKFKPAKFQGAQVPACTNWDLILVRRTRAG